VDLHAHIVLALGDIIIIIIIIIIIMGTMVSLTSKLVTVIMNTFIRQKRQNDIKRLTLL